MQVNSAQGSKTPMPSTTIHAPTGGGSTTQFLRPKEAHKMLGISRSTLYLWMKGGQIPFVRINGLPRFDREVVVAWARANAKADM